MEERKNSKPKKERKGKKGNELFMKLKTRQKIWQGAFDGVMY